AEKILKSWGLIVETGSTLFRDHHQYLAGTDEERVQDFQTMLDEKEVKAIICARGGYGTTRVIDRFDFNAFQAHPKWIVGFSDVTALHLKLMKIGVESIHGLMPILFAKQEYAESLESLKQILFGFDVLIHAKPNSYNLTGKSTGTVVGGNLSLLADSLGTATEPDLNQKILVIEEVDEYFYKIDRMLTQLKRAGKLDKLSGLVVGHMSDLKDTTPGFGELVEEIIVDKVKEFDYPVAFDLPIGHENPNLAWRHGSRMTLTVAGEGSLLSSEKRSI
ncbi:MAG: LD-carboxypeptidase, partial [Marivirga sp.]|nr:LD-carboxypeptidase [Marivirga sp.]